MPQNERFLESLIFSLDTLPYISVLSFLSNFYYNVMIYCSIIAHEYEFIIDHVIIIRHKLDINLS